MMRKLFTWLMLLGISWSLVGCGPPAAVEDTTPVSEDELEDNESMGDIDFPEDETSEGEEAPPA